MTLLCLRSLIIALQAPIETRSVYHPTHSAKTPSFNVASNRSWFPAFDHYFCGVWSECWFNKVRPSSNPRHCLLNFHGSPLNRQGEMIRTTKGKMNGFFDFWSAASALIVMRSFDSHIRFDLCHSSLAISCECIKANLRWPGKKSSRIAPTYRNPLSISSPSSTWTWNITNYRKKYFIFSLYVWES